MAEDRTPKAAVTRQAPRKTGLLRHIARGLMALVATLMVIAIVGFWIVGNYVAGKIFPFAGTGSTVSDEIVSITLAMGECETAIKVEKAYLIFRKNWSGGRQEFVEMAITYPEMTPWSVYARSREVSDAEKLRKKIYSTIHPARRLADMRDLPKRWNALYVGEQFGLKKYRRQSLPSGGRGREPLTTHYFISPHSNSENIAITCWMKAVRCHAVMQFEKSYWVDFHLPVEHLSEWRTVQSAIRQFVTSAVTRSTC